MPPANKRHKVGVGFIKRIFDHWDAEEKLCDSCEIWWASRSLALRKEIRHTYEFEADL